MGMTLSAFLLIGILSFQNGPDLSGNQDGQKRFLQVSLRASALRSRGEYEKAAAALQEAMSIAEKANLDHSQRQCLMRMALLRWDLGSMAEAERLFYAAMLAFQKAGDMRASEFCAKCVKLTRLYDEGKKDRDAKYYFRSLERFQEAIMLGRDTGIPDFELKCLRQQSLTYWEMGRLESFLACNVQGLKISSEIHHDVEKGRCLNNIGITYHKQNEFAQAAEYLENALSTIRIAGDRPSEAECLSNLGLLYRDLGNYDRALYFLDSALALDKDLADCGSISTDLENIGSVFLRRGLDNRSRHDLLAGLDALQECVSIRGRSRTDGSAGFTVLNNIGIIYNELGEHRESRMYFHDALRAVERRSFVPEKGQILSNIAASYLYEGRFDEALRHFRESYDIGVANSLENVVIESCFGLGKCYELTHARSAAIDFYQRSISALENVRDRLSSELLTIGFSRNKLAAYQSLIGLLTAAYLNQPSPGLLEQVFGFVERAKARAFLQRIQDADIDKTEWSSFHLKERQQRLSQNIAELTGRLSRPDLHEGERILIQRELEHEEDEYLRVTLSFREQPQEGRERAAERICSRQDVQSRILDDRTILLEYYLGEARSYLILVAKKGMKLFVLGGKAELEDSLRAYLKIISERSAEDAAIRGASERIGRELLPFLDGVQYPGASSLIIIPDGVLHYLPFETLRIDHEDGPRYLIEDFTVSYGPSASSILALHSMPRDRAWKKDLLAFGGPLYDPGIAQKNEATLRQGTALRRLSSGRTFDFHPLPYSQQEVREVASLFSRERVDVLVGKAASEDAIRALPLQDYRIIHLACHGVLDENRPLRSALVLSTGSEHGNDGFLEMREIYGLLTAADLIVLSACQTARGLLEHAEGPMGIARSFFFTGARSVLASLWSINDKPVVVFMREFYRNLLSGRAAKEALRLAKLTLLRSSWSHPYYWASFVLIGDPGAE